MPFILGFIVGVCAVECSRALVYELVAGAQERLAREARE